MNIFTLTLLYSHFPLPSSSVCDKLWRDKVYLTIEHYRVYRTPSIKKKLIKGRNCFFTSQNHQGKINKESGPERPQDNHFHRESERGTRWQAGNSFARLESRSSHICFRKIGNRTSGCHPIWSQRKDESSGTG